MPALERFVIVAVGMGLASAACESSKTGENPGAAGSLAEGGTSTGGVGATSGEAGSARGGSSNGGSNAVGGTGAGDGGSGAAAGSGAGSGAGPPLPPELTWTRIQDLGVSNYEGVWGSGPNDVYTVSAGGVVYHYDGTDPWTAQGTGTSLRLTGIWGSGPNDIYVSVLADFVLHSTGSGTWDSETLGSGLTFEDVWGIDEHVYALEDNALFHRVGSGMWEPESVGGLVAIWGSSPTDLYAVRETLVTDNIFHSAGDGTWQAQTNTGNYMYDVWGTGSDRIWASGADGVFFSTGNGAWTLQLDLPDDSVRAVWAMNRDTLYACGANTFYRSNGAGSWSAAQPIDASSVLLSCEAIWGTAPDNLYLATTGGLYHGTAP